MPLLHQTMIFSLRLNREAVEHPRLADGEIADVDHLLHLAFAFRDDLAGLERHELAELGFRVAERVAELADGLAANRAGRRAPRLKGILSPRDCLFVFGIGSRTHARQEFAVD